MSEFRPIKTQVLTQARFTCNVVLLYIGTAHSDSRARSRTRPGILLVKMAHAVVEPPKYVNASRVKEVLKYGDLIPVIEEALVNFSARESGGVVQPVRSAVQMEDRG